MEEDFCALKIEPMTSGSGVHGRGSFIIEFPLVIVMKLDSFLQMLQSFAYVDMVATRTGDTVNKIGSLLKGSHIFNFREKTVTKGVDVTKSDQNVIIDLFKNSFDNVATLASERNGEKLSSYFSSIRVIQRMMGERGFTDGGDEIVRVSKFITFCGAESIV